MIRQVVFVLFILFSAIESGWCALGLEQKQFYFKRDFSALEMAKMPEADRRFVQSQKSDLRSCRLVNEGAGDIKSVLICIRFLAHEKSLGLSDSKSQVLFGEMDRLCSAGASSIPHTENVLELKILWRAVPKSQCLQEVLRTARQQIRNLHRRNLVKAWGLYKKVLAELNPTQKWQNEIKQWSGF